MRRALDFAYDLAGYLAGACVAAIFVVMIAQTVMRELGLRTGGSDDIVAWLTAAAAFLAMAHTFKHGDFVRVGLVLERLGPAARRGLEIFVLVVGSIAATYLALAGCRFVYESWQFNDMATGLIAMPLWIPQSSFVAGASLFALAMIDELVRTVRGAVPSYVEAVAARHARGDFSEDV